MYKKTITYTDYNGVERTEDFWFNLSKAELVEMEMSTAGGLTDMVEKIVKTQDMPSIIKIFKNRHFLRYRILKGSLINLMDTTVNNRLFHRLHAVHYQDLQEDDTSGIWREEPRW